MVDLYVTLIESIFYVDDHVANNFNHYRNNLCCIVADSKHIFTTIEFYKHYTRAFLKANRAERSRISFKPIPFSYCTQHSQRPCWIRHEVLRHINKHVSSTSRPTSGPTTAAICTRSPSTKCNAAPPPVQAPVAQPPVSLVPILSDPELKLQFGRLMSRRRVVTLDVNPGGLTRVITRVYQTMVRSFGGVLDAPIEQAPFLQMVRTLILKRLQDLVEGATGIRPDNPIRIARTLPVPQPIGELLYSLGTYYAQWNGIRYELRPSPAPPPQNHGAKSTHR
ncbi:hypothetical protein JTB14_023468 [Gonioctena quinquepunctata]|nr:hypothetical protein JTB14_023468 [Gonioctena quinquepunctata]